MATGLLLSHLDTLYAGGAPELIVVGTNGTNGTNGSDVPPLYRWLVMLHGIAPAGYRSFDGPEWSLPSKLGASDAAAGV